MKTNETASEKSAIFKKNSKMADFMARNVLLYFWNKGKMGGSREIKRCFVSDKPIQ